MLMLFRDDGVEEWLVVLDAVFCELCVFGVDFCSDEVAVVAECDDCGCSCSGEWVEDEVVGVGGGECAELCELFWHDGEVCSCVWAGGDCPH